MSLKFRQAFKSTIFRSCKRQPTKRTNGAKHKQTTYRFCGAVAAAAAVGAGGNRGERHPDTNLTFMQVHMLNGLGKRLPGGHKCFYKYSPAIPAKLSGERGAGVHSDSSASLTPRLEEHLPMESANDIKFHSHNPRPSHSSVSNPSSRHYHSFA